MRGAMRGYMRSRDIDEAALAHFVSVLTDGAAARDAVDPEAFVRIAHAAVGPMPGGADRLQSVLDVWYVATILGHPDAPRVRPPAPSLAHAIAFLRQAQPRGGLLRAMQPVYQYIFRQSLRRCGVAEAEGVPDVPWERVMQDIPPQSVIMRVYLLTHVVLYATDLGLAPRVCGSGSGGVAVAWAVPQQSARLVRPFLGTVRRPSVTLQPPSVTLQPPSVTLQPPSVTLQPPSVTLQPPSVTLQPPSVTPNRRLLPSNRRRLPSNRRRLPPTAVGYPPTAVGYPPTAVGYPPTAVGYPLTAVGYPPTAVGYPPTAVGYPQPPSIQAKCSQEASPSYK